jgi:DNA-binding transcriptional ArsR family regulator
MNMTDAVILAYIRENDGQWASATMFQKAVGLGKSQLSEHLNRLKAQGMLASTLEKQGRTKVKVFCAS